MPTFSRARSAIHSTDLPSELLRLRPSQFPSEMSTDSPTNMSSISPTSDPTYYRSFCNSFDVATLTSIIEPSEDPTCYPIFTPTVGPSISSTLSQEFFLEPICTSTVSTVKQTPGCISSNDLLSYY